MDALERIIPNSFVKNIALQIRPDYDMENNPYNSPDDAEEEVSSKKRDEEKPKEKPNDTFIGREQHKAKFLEFLKSKSKKGIFLVTGFRGMGKTSFVNHVIKEYKDVKPPKRDEKKQKVTKDGIMEFPETTVEKVRIFFAGAWVTAKKSSVREDIQNKKRKNQEIAENEQNKINKDRIIPIHLTLAQNNPKEIDILRLMVTSINDEYSSFMVKKLALRNRWQRITSKENVVLKLQRFLVPVLVLAIIVIAFLLKTNILKDIYCKGFSWFSRYNSPLTVACGLIFIYFLVYFFYKRKISEQEKSTNAEHRIKRLFDRCYSTLSEENSNGDEISFQGFNTKLSGGNEKKVKQYPVATAKEIEYELHQFLKATEHEKLEFIFIFDELDKVELTIGTPYFYNDSDIKETTDSYENKIRDRKQAVISIIAGLKNFFTTANARFIFIAGREMFDASLADVADRQSSISSIFTYIFNIESFLKEKNINGADHNKNNASLSYAIEEHLKKIIFQDAHDPEPAFENESLFKMIERLYGHKEKRKSEYSKLYFTLQNFVTYLSYRSNGSPKKLIKEIHEFISVKKGDDKFDEEQTIIFRQKKGKSTLYLHFNYNNQYRIGFISYLYRPFLIKHGRSYKFYSDNIIQSTPYLFDHLLKFHAFAFSQSNLELIPEVLSTNKTPGLRNHIKQIIDHLSANHLREIEIGLFNYKFFSRTLNEITFLSKISEQEAAGFNFTLDESYLVKLHVIDKIRELRVGYGKFIEKDNSGTQQFFSITHLNGILGDLHFFDQEYNDAIIAYSDAIRPINGVTIEEMNIPDFITMVKTKLKIGLCFEKINSFDEASAQYSECSRDVAKFTLGFKTNIINTSNIQRTNVKETSDPLLLRELLQIIIQSVLAKIIIKEKMRFTGARDLAGSIIVFLEMVNDIHKDRTHNNLLIKANLFLHLGNLLYYKNSAGVSIGELTDKHFLRDTFYIKMDLLQRIQKEEFFSHENNKIVNDQSKKRPVSALYMYIIGLCETLASKNVFEEDPWIKTINKAKVTWARTNDALFDSILCSTNIVGSLLEKLNTQKVTEHAGLRGWDHRYIAYFLSNIGDCLLGLYDAPRENYAKYKISQLFDTAKLQEYSKGNDIEFNKYLKRGSNFGLADVLNCYYLSGEFFLKHGRDVSCSFQFRKILHVLRLVIVPEENPSVPGLAQKLMEIIEDLLVKPTLRIISNNAGNTDIHMMEKATHKELITVPFSLNNISNHPESREVVLLFNFVKIKLKLFNGPNGLKISGIPNLININNSLATQYSRIMELDFNAKYTYQQLKENIILDKNQEEFSWNKLIVTYIYSVLSMIRILDIYTMDYLIGYRFCAYTHYNLGRFLVDYENDISDAVKNNINYLLGEGSWASLDPTYHFKAAKNLFEKTIRLHTAGTEYKNMINDMIYLEDDFNDNAYHFGAAIDRYLIVNGALKERIRICNETYIIPMDRSSMEYL